MPASVSASSGASTPPPTRRWIASRIEPRPRRGRLAQLAGVDATHALVVLGEVEQLEPARERADEDLGLVRGQAGDELGERPGRLGVTVARGAGELHAADVQLERRVAAGRADDLLEDSPQQLLVLVEGSAHGPEP